MVHGADSLSCTLAARHRRRTLHLVLGQRMQLWCYATRPRSQLRPKRNTPRSLSVHNHNLLLEPSGRHSGGVFLVGKIFHRAEVELSAVLQGDVPCLRCLPSLDELLSKVASTVSLQSLDCGAATQTDSLFQPAKSLAVGNFSFFA